MTRYCVPEADVAARDRNLSRCGAHGLVGEAGERQEMEAWRIMDILHRAAREGVTASQDMKAVKGQSL